MLLVPVLDLPRGHAHGQAADDHVALAGEVIQERRVDAQQRGVAGGVDGALLGGEQAGDRAQQGGLAGAVAADDADRVAAVGHEGDAADGVHLADRRRGAAGAACASSAVAAVPLSDFEPNTR